MPRKGRVRRKVVKLVDVISAHGCTAVTERRSGRIIGTTPLRLDIAGMRGSTVRPKPGRSESMPMQVWERDEATDHRRAFYGDHWLANSPHTAE